MMGMKTRSENGQSPGVIKNTLKRRIMKEITEQQLKEILEQHSIWSETDGEKGERADLSHTDLRSASLEGVNLSNADLSNASLFNAILFNANLFNANLENTNLENANLKFANLFNAKLYKAKLYKANLFNANLYKADLEFADLENANLFNANLFNAKLYKANLFNANLFNANLENVERDEKQSKTRTSMKLISFEQGGKITPLVIVKNKLAEEFIEKLPLTAIDSLQNTRLTVTEVPVCKKRKDAEDVLKHVQEHLHLAIAALTSELS